MESTPQGQTSSAEPLGPDPFLKHLGESGLLTPDEIKAVLAKLPHAHRQDARLIAQELVKQQKLTKYQATMLSQGKTKGLILGNYAILDKIGQGGMGMVFKAQHRRMDRIVALKVLPPSVTKNTTAVKRFQREVQAAARLSHPNIVAAFDADEFQGVHFLVMELVEGSDLSQLVKKQGPLAVAAAVECIRQAACGLAHAHAAGIVHRDIKPSNLLVSGGVVSGESSKGTTHRSPLTIHQVKILDMGLARIDGASSPGQGSDELTQTGSIMGTCDYMAPEQALNTRKADQRADIYSLGCTLYFLLTGKVMYGGETQMEKLMAHREEPIPPLANAPAALQTVFERMVAKKVEDRYQSMTEVVSALQACQGAANVGTSRGVNRPAPALIETGTEVTVAGSETGNRSPVVRSRIRRVVAAVAVVLLAGAAAAAFLIGPALSPQTPIAAAPTSPIPTAPSVKPTGGTATSRDEPSTRPVDTRRVDKPVDTRRVEKPVATSPVGPSATPSPRASFLAPLAPQTKEHDGHVTAIAISPDNTLLATATRNAGLKLWDLAKLDAPPRVLSSSGFTCLAFLPSGKALAAGEQNGAIRHWEANTGADRVPLEGFRIPVQAICFAPNGKTLVVAQFGTAPQLHIWEVLPKKSQGQPGPLKEITGAVPQLALSADARWLAWASKKHSVHVVEVASGKEGPSLKGHTTGIQSLALSPDGSLVAAGADDGSIRVWETATGQEKAVFKGHTKAPTIVLAYAPDGSRLASGSWDGNAHLWDIPSQRDRAVYKGHRNGVTALAFSPDGKTLATGSRDMTVKLWDAPGGR